MDIPPKRHEKRKIHPGIKLLNLFHILILLPSPIFFFASLFLFDAPDAGENSFFMTLALLIWAYPVVTIFCLVASRRAQTPKKGLLTAATPFVVVFFIFALFSAA